LWHCHKIEEELTKAQHAYDEVRDEKELMGITHQESADLLRSTEEAIKGLRDEVTFFQKLESAYKIKYDCHPHHVYFL
jgi:deoxyxylulose-5-phosphate synthase